MRSEIACNLSNLTSVASEPLSRSLMIKDSSHDGHGALNYS